MFKNFVRKIQIEAFGNAFLIAVYMKDGDEVLYIAEDRAMTNKPYHALLRSRSNIYRMACASEFSQQLDIVQMLEPWTTFKAPKVLNHDAMLAESRALQAEKIAKQKAQEPRKYVSKVEVVRSLTEDYEYLDNLGFDADGMPYPDSIDTVRTLAMSEGYHQWCNVRDVMVIHYTDGTKREIDIS